MHKRPVKQEKPKKESPKELVVEEKVLEKQDIEVLDWIKSQTPKDKDQRASQH